MSVLVVGSIAIDTVNTPVEEHSNLLGGSASYAAAAASFFSPVRLVGVVGDDFPESEFEFWKSRKIDSEGVQRANGKTFRWSGEYSWDLNTRETRSIALNVFEHFKPALPKSYRETDFVLLANISPTLQSHVLDQMERPRFVVADTMDLWIETTRADLDALLRRVDLLILNDSEAREMTKETSLIRAGRKIREYGPCYVAIKKGEHGALLFGEDDFFGSVWRAHSPATIRPSEYGKRLMIKRDGRSQLCESPSKTASSAEKSCRCSNPRSDRVRFADRAKANEKINQSKA